MTYIEQAIRDALDAGYRFTLPNQNDPLGDWDMLNGSFNHEIFLDPAFWQALGKARGWKDEKMMGCLWRPGEVEGVVVGLCDRNTPTYYAHLFFDHIFANRDAENFFATLV